MAGYADSEGYTAADTPRPFAYKYRDYVIRAFNADKPLDQFITEQLAGDELIDGDLKQSYAREHGEAGGDGLLADGGRRHGHGRHRPGRWPATR